QFFPKADRRKVVTRGAQHSTQKLAFFEHGISVDLQACKRLQRRAANEFRKGPRKGALGAEEIKSSEHAIDPVDDADLPGLRLEGLQKVVDVICPTVETVAKCTGWRRSTERKEGFANAVPDGSLIGRAHPALLQVLGDRLGLAVADLRIEHA